MKKCPVCGMMVDEKKSPTSNYKGTTYYFHNPVHKDMFDKEPEKFLKQQSSYTGMNM
ncbi:MAG: YHS domain-containing protein [Candidatus Hodarchaeales archaeon]|jgi:YHS domain-containing protein